MAWTDKRVEKAADMWRTGSSAAEISKALGGITRNAVIGKMKRLDIVGGAYGGQKRQRTISVSGKNYKVVPTPTPDWTEAQTLELIQMWDSGRSSGYIADATGRTIWSVKSKIGRLHTRGLLARDDARAVVPKPPRTPKAPAKKREVYGVKQMHFPGVRDEARVEGFTMAGLTQVEKFDARMPNTGVPLLEIRAFQCRFPTSNSWPWLMCGEPAERGSYCPSCSNRVTGRIAA